MRSTVGAPSMDAIALGVKRETTFAELLSQLTVSCVMPSAMPRARTSHVKEHSLRVAVVAAVSEASGREFDCARVEEGDKRTMRTGIASASKAGDENL